MTPTSLAAAIEPRTDEKQTFPKGAWHKGLNSLHWRSNPE